MARRDRATHRRSESYHLGGPLEFTLRPRLARTGGAGHDTSFVIQFDSNRHQFQLPGQTADSTITMPAIDAAQISVRVKGIAIT